MSALLALPDSARATLDTEPLGIYVHVPFCASRCGYCDFNTYTAAELPDGGARTQFAATVAAELDLAVRVLQARPVHTVFFGGGTPTLLPAEDLGAILTAIRERFELAPGAEVTTEANPESVDDRTLGMLREAGFTRLSLGMQSAAPHVLRTLERAHTPGRAVTAAREARAAGFEHVSLDLIYGTPGETQEDWRTSLESALSAQPDHISAYGLIVEAGTRLAAQVRRGELPAPDDDAMAERYALADTLLEQSGMHWYEMCNWAATPDASCRHNLGYWRSANWWGAGPGAHSHIGGVRWSNVLHPSAYARTLAEGRSPAAEQELLNDDERRFERVMLDIRLRGGLDPSQLGPAGTAALPRLLDDDLLIEQDGRLVLTLQGRLKADAVTRELTE